MWHSPQRPLPKNTRSPASSCSLALRIKAAERIQLRRGREIDDVLHLRHHRDLVGPVGQMDAFARRADVVAIEIGGALLEFA